MEEDLARGKTMLREERYHLVRATGSDDELAVQVTWRGVLAVDVGALKAGDSMLCESAIFFLFQGDKIIEQHNYDCFEDFRTARG